MKEKNYHDEVATNNTKKLRSLLKELPPFLQDFFRGISDSTSARTRTAYAYDLKVFFQFLSEENSYFCEKKTAEISVADLDQITATDIEVFMEYLSYYVKNTETETLEYQNHERGKMRKLAAIRTLYGYFFKKERIKTNPSVLVDMPKLHNKPIIRLDVHEVARLLDEVENGAGLSDTQKKFHAHNRKRDLAIITLLLGTGIRISECVGLNIIHIDFETNAIKVTRKGGNETLVYFGAEVEEALKDYLEERNLIDAAAGSEDALFLSLQKTRLTDRSIQLLVKKYASLVTTLKKITPHKLRSTYGTNLYRESNDIYLVAEVLGHADVNTTRKHYADMEEDRKRQAANIVKLRKD